MLTNNTRFARKVLADTLGIGCLAMVIPWLAPLAGPLFFITRWPKSRKAAHWLTLAGVALCLLVTAIALVDAVQHLPHPKIKICLSIALKSALGRIP